MIAARMANVKDADQFLREAQRRGKAKYLCDMQAAKARIEQVRKRIVTEGGEFPEARQRLMEARALLHGADVDTESSLYLREKSRAERERLVSQIEDLFNRRSLREIVE
jgi:hypothetical protein